MKGWVDKCNAEMHYNMAAALDAGFKIPEFMFLQNMSEEEQVEVASDPAWEIIGGMAMEKPEGIPATFHLYYDNGELSLETVSIEDTRLLSGNVGPDIHDNATTLFCGTNHKIRQCLERMVEKALSHEGEYRGLVNARMVFPVKGEPVCRLITYGITEKLLFTLLKLYGGGVQTFFDASTREIRESSVHGYGVSLRVYAHPWDIEWNKRINVAGHMLSWDGESFVAAEHGDTIKGAWRSVYDSLESLNENICYAQYSDIRARRIFNELMRLKYVKRLESGNLHRVDSGPVPIGNGSGILPDAEQNNNQEKDGDQNSNCIS